MVQEPFFLSFFYGFVPAMGFLYIVLHEYQEFFNEKRVFRVFLFGLIIGAVVTIAEQVMSPPVVGVLGSEVTRLEQVGIILVDAFLVALLESLVFAAFLNWRAFRGRRDTPYYGVGFGLGFGGTHVILLLFFILMAQQRDLVTLGVTKVEELVLLTFLGLYFIGGILVHGAMGAWIGQGAGSGGLPRAIGRATAARTLYYGLFFAVVLVPSAPASYALALLGVSAGVWTIGRVMSRLLDFVVPPEILREMGIHNRRLARKLLRDAEPADASPHKVR